ncbi:MAG: folate family ECF transporter S component [Clostridia bacterium]|nr:folate family ECF transporter S component [Clostridia bacterium]
MKRKASKPLRVSVTLAMLAAISIVCGKFLALNLTDFMRFSFENLPVIFAGIMYGPLAGAAVGAVADLLGSIMVGYAINPIITVGAATVGLVSGVTWWLTGILDKLPHGLSIGITVGVAHIIGSVIIKSLGLMVFYSIPLYLLMAWRLLNYLIVGVVEGLLIYILTKSPALMDLMK